MAKIFMKIKELDISHWYIAFLCLTGIITFIWTNGFSFINYSSEEWVKLYVMLGAALILNSLTFRLPPEGNVISFDSSIYLACMFIYGSQFTLAVLLLCSLSYFVYKRNVPWWKKLTNFSLYSIMITLSFQVFLAFNGTLGPVNGHNLASYILALTSYFGINTIGLFIYYYLLYRTDLANTLKGFVKDTILVYLCMLILSLVLCVLIVNNGTLGLILFLSLGIMLSHAFRLLFSMYHQILNRSNIDQRTALYNHSFFESSLDYHIIEAKVNDRALSLAMIDIDDFKKYNDSFGHLKGDLLISFLGSMLKEETKDTSIVASRYGGEEFTLLMPGYDYEKARHFVDKLRKKLNDTPFDGVEVFPHKCLSFSAGIAQYSIDLYDKSQLVDHADKALYYAKKQGKNTVHTYGCDLIMEDELDLSHEVNYIEQQLNLFMYKDIDTFKHSKRVYKYALDMSNILSLDKEEKREFVLGALIHDIGKLEIPWGVLNKEGKLTPEEWETIKQHVTWGKKIALTDPRFRDLIPYIELHHERFDGKGYPHGLKGKEIPKLCRMLTVLDSFDAMTTERPYQKTKTLQEGIIELRACAGTQFDPELVEIFIAYILARSPKNELTLQEETAPYMV
ncbi:diguanylate cyclase [Paenibacillus polygoni]|uniref:Diguanylate cyclase n=1 Tax=Paenibacillus polygoni TaxID=3050112 RepID=A0ABY8X6A8_9BACL|nr:diguanylate cyclase [Paenibacillus polygoni]WIV19509.1 diguanylate cyclase [Paenibacillus polygoni]